MQAAVNDIDMDEVLLVQKLLGHPPLEMNISAYGLFTLLGLVQLALQNPALQGETTIAEQLGRAFVQSAKDRLSHIDPAIASLIDQGWETIPQLQVTPGSSHVN